jgi:hypothetical protein
VALLCIHASTYQFAQSLSAQLRGRGETCNTASFTALTIVPQFLDPAQYTFPDLVRYVGTGCLMAHSRVTEAENADSGARATAMSDPEHASRGTPYHNHIRPGNRALNDESTNSAIDTLYAEASQSKPDNEISKAASINDTALVSHKGKRKYEQALGQESTEHSDNRATKRLYWNEATIQPSPARRGHSFSYVCIEGNARAHMGDRYGDQITIVNNYHGLLAAMDMRLSQDADLCEKIAIIQFAASVLVVDLVGRSLVHFMLFLLRAMNHDMPRVIQQRAPSLVNMLSANTVLFEDALGRFERIDIDVVNNWTAFHYRLTSAFVDKPGTRRVAVAGYRLFGHNTSGHPIDPIDPPEFSSVFRRNKHVRMSIHFQWHEVSLECCPKCGLKQRCEPDEETTCRKKTCGFHYRGQVGKSQVNGVDGVMGRGGADEESNPNKDDKRTESRTRLLKNAEENPAWFFRISVSKQPENIEMCEISQERRSSTLANVPADAIAPRPNPTRHALNLFRFDFCPGPDRPSVFTTGPGPFHDKVAMRKTKGRMIDDFLRKERLSAKKRRPLIGSDRHKQEF